MDPQSYLCVYKFIYLLRNNLPPHINDRIKLILPSKQHTIFAIHTQTHTHTDTHSLSHSLTHTQTDTHTLSQAHTHTCTHKHARMHTRTHNAHTHAHTHTHTRTHTQTHTYMYITIINREILGTGPGFQHQVSEHQHPHLLHTTSTMHSLDTSYFIQLLSVWEWRLMCEIFDA